MRFVQLAGVMIVVSLSACTATRRGGQNALVVATYPVHGVTTPYARTAALVADGFTPWAAPLPFTAFALEDAFLTSIAAADLALTPLYLPFEVGPLDVYAFHTFPPRIRIRNAQRVEQCMAALVTVGAYGFALNRGYARARASRPSRTYVR